MTAERHGVAIYRRFFRFRIASLLLLIAAVASGVTHVVALRRQRALEQENRALRKETGRPVIRDPRRIAVGTLRFPAQSAYRFRVYLPPNRHVELKYAFNASRETLPAEATVVELDGLSGAELTIDVSLETHSQEENGAHELSINIQATDGHGIHSHGSGARFEHWNLRSDQDNLGFIVDEISADEDAGVSDLPRVLLRLKGGTTTEFKSGTDRTAVLLWLDEAKDDDSGNQVLGD
jgi:hypothetical protein